uniref:PDZ domain-containing protein n=1 Tax=Myripristis murdjan TaxID=586833 RepID=A0A667Z5M0_9TELE
MDLSLLPTPVSEYNNQRTGPRFTVRSANSPSYVLNHRQGLRISRARSEDRRENLARDSKKETCREEERGPPLEQWQRGTDNESHPVTGNQANVSGQEKETSGHKTSGQLKQNGTSGKAVTESGSDRSGNYNPECGRRGRTEWRRHYLPNRSKSLDWRTGASSPDRGTKADNPASLIFSGNHGRVIPKDVESLEKRRRTGDGDRIEGTESRVLSAVKAYNSAGTGNVVGERSAELSHIGNNLDRVGRGQSLPSRLRLRVGSDSGIKETGPKGGQSILERIEKLYGSGKTEDSTRSKDTSSFMRDSPTSPPANQGRRLRVGDLVERVGKEDVGGGNSHADDFGKYSRLKDTLALPLNGEAKRQRHRKFYIDETDFAKVTSPERSSNTDITNNDTPPSLLSNSDDLSDVQKATPTGSLSPVSDEDKTPTNTPESSPFLSHHSLPENTAANAGRQNESTPVSTHTRKTPAGDAPHLLLPHAASPHSCLPDLSPPDVTVPSLGGGKWDEDLVARVAGWNLQIKGWNGDEDDEDDDDEGTEKDEDSNYDSDSGDSSVTITSNMSQSDRRSFSVSLADLCNFGGVEFDDESENENDEWLSGRRSASLSSDVSALSCVSMLPNEELDRLISITQITFSLPLHLFSLTLRRARTRGMGVVVLRRGGVGSTCMAGVEADSGKQAQTEPTEPGQRVCVRLEKQSRDLGFSLVGGVGSSQGDKPLSIQKIFQGGPVNKVCPGDELLEIQGVNVVGMRRLEAWNLIRRLPPGPVDVVLHRPIKHSEI